MDSSNAPAWVTFFANHQEMNPS